MLKLKSLTVSKIKFLDFSNFFFSKLHTCVLWCVTSEAGLNEGGSTYLNMGFQNLTAS